MYKIGNLFELAESRLIREKKLGIISYYTEIDVIEYAILIRKWLDKNPKIIKKLLRLTKEERKIKNREHRKQYYLKTGK